MRKRRNHSQMAAAFSLLATDLSVAVGEQRPRRLMSGVDMGEQIGMTF